MKFKPKLIDQFILAVASLALLVSLGGVLLELGVIPKDKLNLNIDIASLFGGNDGYECTVDTTLFNAEFDNGTKTKIVINKTLIPNSDYTPLDDILINNEIRPTIVSIDDDDENYVYYTMYTGFKDPGVYKVVYKNYCVDINVVK